MAARQRLSSEPAASGFCIRVQPARAVADAMGMKTVKSTIVPWRELLQ